MTTRIEKLEAEALELRLLADRAFEELSRTITGLEELLVSLGVTVPTPKPPLRLVGRNDA